MGGGSLIPQSSTNPETPPTAITRWEPAVFLADPESSAVPKCPSRSTLALLILNQEITHRRRILTIWRNSHIRVCADGGANRLYNIFGNDAIRAQFLPDCIIGDLDSLLPHVRAYYESQNVPVIRNPSQESTDFGKALDWIDSHHDRHNMTVIAWGGFGGRVDQSFHSIHALYYDRYTSNSAEKAPPKSLSESAPSRRIYILSSLNVTFLLYPGLNTISTPHNVFWKTCGIIPCGEPAKITTSGLEWNLNNAETRFGGMVSTSNHLKEEVVTISTDKDIVFTVEIRGGEKEDEDLGPVNGDGVGM